MWIRSLLGALLMGTIVTGAEPEVPETRRVPVTDHLHGDELIDNYRWLENQQAPETRAWLAAQQKYTDAVLATLPDRSALERRATELLRVESVSVPWVRGERLFYSRRAVGQDVPSLCYRERLGGEEIVLVDPAQLRGDGKTTVVIEEISHDGKLLVIGVRTGGEDEVELHFYDVDERKLRAETLPRARYMGVALTPDKNTLYFGTHEHVAGPRVHRIAMNGLRQPAETFFGEGYDPGVIAAPSLSLDGQYLLIHVYFGSSQRNDIYLANLQQGLDLKPFVTGIDAKFDLEAIDHRAFLRTTHNAPRGRLMAVDLQQPQRDQWREIIPQGKGVLQEATLAGGKIYVRWLEDVISRLEVRTADGAREGQVELPALGSVSSVSSGWDQQHVFYSYSSFHIPATIYHREIATEKQQEWARLNVPVDSDSFAVRQVFYPSKDGTQIPMFLAHKKSVTPNGKLPTLLYGYGGFNISLTPSFSPRAVLWMEQGGVFAVANLRGGGEFGEEWHSAGMRGQKQNVFDDFFAAAEWLIANKYTSPTQLAIAGGSNGGLLVGAALTQRPELFGAVVCSYPLLDMVRYHQFLVARFWIPEYGSSEDAEQYRWLAAYSPYHHIKPGTKYPAVLFITGDADTRVDPLHARKMCAALQAASGSKRPILLHYDTTLGHTGARPVSKSIEDLTLEISFLKSQTQP